MGVRGGATHLLARLEERARVRLHQAANRMEDADPVDVTVAQATIKALDVVDRLTGFRDRHAQTVHIEGEPGLPTPPVAFSPEFAGLDPATLTPAQRARLRQRYRRWEQALDAAGLTPDDPTHPHGGHEAPAVHAPDLEASHRRWLDEAAKAGTTA